jgi:hypothetical protein
MESNKFGECSKHPGSAMINCTMCRIESNLNDKNSFLGKPLTVSEYKRLTKKTKQNKHKNIKTECKQGHIHDSKGEANYCDCLKLLEKSGDIKGYESQVKYPLICNEWLICNHIVDFVIITNEGKKEVREFKGKKTRDWVIKYKLFLANYPDVEYKIITK